MNGALLYAPCRGRLGLGFLRRRDRGRLEDRLDDAFWACVGRSELAGVAEAAAANGQQIVSLLLLTQKAAFPAKGRDVRW